MLIDWGWRRMAGCLLGAGALALGLASAARSDVCAAPEVCVWGRDDLVPMFQQTRGCSPASAAMVLGYWDYYDAERMGKVETDYGKLTKYYLMDMEYFINVSNAVDLLAYYMETDDDGFTDTGNVGHGIEMYTDYYAGYNFSTDVTEYCGSGCDWNWSLAKQEINAHRPFMYSIATNAGNSAHTMAAWGYVDTDTDKRLIVYDTWNPVKRYWQYNVHHGTTDTVSAVRRIIPGGGSHGNDVALDSLLGGNSVKQGAFQKIWWYQFGELVNTVLISYSIDNGGQWIEIARVGSSHGFNMYDWLVPETITYGARVKIMGFQCAAGAHPSSENAIAGDGSFGDFAILWNNPAERPRNPTQCIEAGGAHDDTWQRDVRDPRFTCSGAQPGSDGEIMGYYYYWGPDPEGAIANYNWDHYTIPPIFDPPAVPSGVYYLRVRTRGVNGNMAQDFSTTFTFKYDRVPPLRPSSLRVVGSTGIGGISFHGQDRDLTIKWRSTDRHSGIKGYSFVADREFHTMPDHMIDSAENHTTIRVPDVPCMFFHVKASDNAGNWSMTEHFRMYLLDGSLIVDTFRDPVIPLDDERLPQECRLTRRGWIP